MATSHCTRYANLDATFLCPDHHSNRRSEKCSLWYKVRRDLSCVHCVSCTCVVSSGGVVIYFDRVEVVNILAADQGTANYNDSSPCHIQ